MKKISIIGGGIGGLCAAIALLQKNMEVRVFEATPELKALGAGLALSGNAAMALEMVGLAGSILEAGNAFDQVRVLTKRGKIILKTDALKIAAKYGAANFALHRADLQSILVDSLPEGVLQLGKKCIDTEESGQEVKAYFEDGSVAASDGLIAFDGIHSAVRHKFLPQSQLRYAGYTCWRAVIHRSPENFNPKLFTETWGSCGRFGIVPLTGHRIYWFATMNAPKQDARLRDFRVADLAKNFRQYHHPIPEILDNTADEQLIWNDIMDLEPVERYAFGRILLAGDAAHATTPNMGQGACMAIEDAVVAANLLACEEDIPQAFRLFEQRRKKRTKSIVQASFRLGKLAQLKNPVWCAARNMMFGMIPERIQDKQIRNLYEVELKY